MLKESKCSCFRALVLGEGALCPSTLRSEPGFSLHNDVVVCLSQGPGSSLGSWDVTHHLHREPEPAWRDTVSSQNWTAHHEDKEIKQKKNKFKHLSWLAFLPQFRLFCSHMWALQISEVTTFLNLDSFGCFSVQALLHLAEDNSTLILGLGLDLLF